MRMLTSYGRRIALGISKNVALNFSLASGLLLMSAALTAAAMGLSGSLVLTLRARQASHTSGVYDAEKTNQTALLSTAGNSSPAIS